MDTFGLEFWSLTLCLVGISIGGFLRGFLGFGAALVIVPILSIPLPPVVAIAILVIIEIPNAVYLVRSSIHEANLKTVQPMLFGLIVAVPVGTAVLVQVDPEKMRLVISVILLMTVGLLASGWRIKGKLSGGILFASGAVGGLIQGSAGMGGPPLVTTLMSMLTPANVTRANIIAVLSALSLVNLMTLIIYGKINLNILIFGASGAPLYVFWNWLGARFFREKGNERFRQVALTALAAIALVTIYTNMV